MLFNFFKRKACGCLSVGIGFCLEIGFNGRNFSL